MPEKIIPPMNSSALPSRTVRRGLIDNRVIGVILLVALEIMLFTGLIGAYIVARTSAVTWPPMRAPQLNALSGGIATAVILLSNLLLAVAGILTRRGLHAEPAAQDEKGRAASRRHKTLINGLIVAALFFGLIFSAMQIMEWRQFVFDETGRGGYGVALTPAPEGGFFTLLQWHMGRATYSAFFFTMTILHGLHLWIGMLVLGLLALRGRLWEKAGQFGTRLEVTAWFWHFIGGMWLALYYLLYILR